MTILKQSRKIGDDLSSTSSLIPDIVNLLNKYVRLQGGLVEELKRQYGSIENWDTIQQMRKVGNGEVIEFDGRSWRLKRHGLGVVFVDEAEGTVIDALDRLESAPRGFDPSRIEAYLDSIECQKVAYMGRPSPVDYDHLFRIFVDLEKRGILTKIDRFNTFVLREF